MKSARLLRFSLVMGSDTAAPSEKVLAFTVFDDEQTTAPPKEEFLSAYERHKHGIQSGAMPFTLTMQGRVLSELEAQQSSETLDLLTTWMLLMRPDDGKTPDTID